MTARSFSLGRRGEAQWEHMRAAYVLSRLNGEIMLVAPDSRDVRDEVRRRLESMTPRLAVIEPNGRVTRAIHALAKTRVEGETLPVAWIEAPASSPSPESDMCWLEALAVLNLTRDALWMHGPCHVVLAGPRALHEVVCRRAPALASFMTVMLLLDDTLEELVTHEGTLTWLHLSDLHVQNESWQQDHVLGALVRDLPKLLEERELRPDLLFVTGDVAARGQRAEYDGAVRLLDEIARRLGLDRRQQVFVVPGNHDVDRAKIKPLAKRDHASLLGLSAKDLRDAVGDLLGDAHQFAFYGERLDDWCAFTETLLGRARSVSMERPWRSDVIDVRGLPVGVLSLCTAWASGSDDRKGSLILGERQIHDMVAEARDGGAQVVIALMHHPLHWLHDEEYSAIRGRLERDVDVVLHGHVHDAHVALHLAAGSEHMEIGAGAAYAGLDQDRYHGFSVGRFDIAKERLDMHCFTWSTQSGRWHPAAGVRGADDDGRVSFAFSPAAIAPEGSRKGGQEVLATRLRHAAAKVYATVDFAGLRAGGPRRHVTLEEIFVPLRLTAKGLDSPELSWFEGDVEEETVFERGDAEDDGPEDDIPDDVDVFRGRGESLEGGIVDAFTRISGRLTLAGLTAMLATGRKVIVLGGPGSGKSTLAKHIASTTAQREGGPVPLLLTVRDWVAEGKREHLLDMAARQAGVSLSVRTDRGALEALCERGNVLLIVDGVDEAADPAVRRELRDQLHGFVAAYSGVPVLVTSRIAGYHDVPLNDEEFDELTLEPFDDEAIEQFVRRWYELVEDDPAARLRRRVDLLHALEVEPRAKELARNPLLATLIGMVHFSQAQLPGDRAKLYGLIIELLLVTWPAERKRELPELHGAVQQPMLEKLALRLQEQRSSTRERKDQAEVLIGVDQLESLLEELLAEHLRERSAPERRYLARKWGKWLVDGCGLLQEQQPGRVGFLHLSLMEYMAGRALFDRTVVGGYEAVAELVAARHDQAGWRETLLLMLGSENKKRELGQAVVERLLAIPPDDEEGWSAWVFGLALLREEMNVGPQRDHLLERTCEVAINMTPLFWHQASEHIFEVVRFSRAHGEGTREWLQMRVSSAVSESLVGVLAVSAGALGIEDIEARLSARELSAVDFNALLDFGPSHLIGRWAREHSNRDATLAWVRSTPVEGVIWRSFEGLVAGASSQWILAFKARAACLARMSHDSADRQRRRGPCGLPSGISWHIDEGLSVDLRLVSSLVGKRLAFAECVESLRFTNPVASHFAEAFAREFSRGLAQSFSRYFIRDFAQYFALGFSRPFAMRHSQPEISRYFASGVLQTFAKQFVRYFQRNFIRDVLPRLQVRPIEDSMGTKSNTSSLWAQIRQVRSESEAEPIFTKMFVILMADAYAGLVSGHAAEDPDIASVLAGIRIENRWLNLFFTPLVEYATRTRPLASNPDLHALLLTYGLIQYQTTWEWPDCPHWRSWLSSDPPAHWLPAHVFHLVRSIQDPTNPTHRALADAALDRNDWPELAQALRETTLVPTPPEVLALFDHGDDPDDTPSPSTPT